MYRLQYKIAFVFNEFLGIVRCSGLKRNAGRECYYECLLTAFNPQFRYSAELKGKYCRTESLFP